MNSNQVCVNAVTSGANTFSNEELSSMLTVLLEEQARRQSEAYDTIKAAVQKVWDLCDEYGYEMMVDDGCNIDPVSTIEIEDNAIIIHLD